MKRLLSTSLSLAAVALAAAPASASSQPPGTDSVVGSASECVEPFEPLPGQVFCARRPSLDVDVRSGASGENPTGTVSLGSLGLTPGGSATVVAQPTCLSVSGGVATIGVSGTWHQGGQGFDAWLAGLIRVVDAGGPASGQDTVEFAFQLADIFGPPLPGPTSCSAFPGPFGTDALFFPDFTNETGDIVVTDASSVPITKEQCKKGGWKRFPGFKNQGQCVRFVATNSPDDRR